MSKTFCPIPFIGIYYKADDNRIKACCWQSGKDAQHIKTHDYKIDRFWRSKKMRNMREDFLNDRWPSGCDACRLPESKGQSSPRLDWKWAWELLGDKQVDLDYGNETMNPMYFDYRPDNICNLGCAMCSPAASSILQKMVFENPELNKDQVLLNTMDPRMNFDDDDEVILTSLGPHTRRMKLNGGEPTISKRIKSIYELCIKNDWAKNIDLQFTTNFTNINKTYNDYLPHFKSINLTASLDGAGDTYNYTRHPAKWNAVKANIFKVIKRDTLKNYNFAVNIVWSATTCFTVDEWLPQMAKMYNEIFDYKRETGIGPRGVGFTVNQCYSPSWVSLTILPDNYKRIVKRKLHKVMRNGEVKRFIDNHPRISKQLEQFYTGLDIFEYNKKDLQLFQNHITIYDKARGTDITKLHKIYKDLIEHDRS